MSIPDEILMAYADGELDEVTRQSVAMAERDDVEVRRRVARHRQLRAQLQSAFAASLEEPVPERLLAAARAAVLPAAEAAATPGTPAPGITASVVPLSAARAAKAQAAKRSHRWRPVSAWGSLAASLILGVFAIYFTWRGADPLLRTAANGRVVAIGALSQALSSELSAERKPLQAASIGLSFRAQTGEYCRTFYLNRNAATGLACREGAEWHIRLLAPAVAGQRPPSDSGYRTASSADSPRVRALVESLIQGEPLTREGEAAARQGGWVADSHR